MHLFTFLSETLLILPILSTWMFSHQYLDSQQLWVWQFELFPLYLLAKFWVISPTTGLCPKWWPQCPFLPGHLLHKVIQSFLEIKTLVKMVHNNLFVTEFHCLYLWNQFTKEVGFSFLCRIFVWCSGRDVQTTVNKFKWISLSQTWVFISSPDLYYFSQGKEESQERRRPLTISYQISWKQSFQNPFGGCIALHN